MTVETTYTNNGDGTSTIAIEITANTDIVLLLSPECSEAIYNDATWIRSIYGGVEWSALTNAQKLDVIGRYTQRKLRTIGYSGYYDDQVELIDGIDTHYGSE